MTRRHWSVPLLAVLAAAAAGCGGPDAPVSDPAADRPAGPLQAAATDGRVGAATTADPEGLRRLARGSDRIDLDRIERRRRDGVGAGASCPDADLMPAEDNQDAMAAATLCLVNGERADAGLPPLSPDARLARAALAHSRDMVARQYFAHDSLDGRDVVDRLRASGYVTDGASWTVGENLAWGTGTLATPQNIVDAWIASPGHRANLLKPSYRQGGLGVAPGNPSSDDGAGATYTMTFGRTSASSQGAAAPTGTRPAAGPATGSAGGGGEAARPAANKRNAKRGAKAKRRKRASPARARTALGPARR